MNKYDIVEASSLQSRAWSVENAGLRVYMIKADYTNSKNAGGTGNEM